MRIIIETIPHDKQRYNTCGDWQWTQTETEAILNIKVSKFPGGMRSSTYLQEFLIGIHEAVEALACDATGIGEKQVDNFDKVYTGDGEPGDDPACPYKTSHCLATGIERILCAALGVDWFEYESMIEKLTETYENDR